MPDSGKTFVQKDVLKYKNEFSWNIGNLTELRGYPKNKEIKIGSCKVKWLLKLELCCDCKHTYLKIGFQRMSLGLHKGTLTFQVKQPNYSVNLITKIIHFGKDDKDMKYEQILQEDLYLLGTFFSGTIAIPECDCIQKPNSKVLEDIIELQNDIHNLMKNELFTDFDIKVGEICFPAHKFILRARSPVFAKMFEHDKKESGDNCITVLDTNETNMKNFLSFLYIGTLKDHSYATVIGLYSLAYKFQVENLQKTCRCLLISNFSETTVLEILKASYFHSDEELKHKAALYISCQFLKIKVRPEWSSLIESNTRLASYVLRFVTFVSAKVFS